MEFPLSISLTNKCEKWSGFKIAMNVDTIVDIITLLLLQSVKVMKQVIYVSVDSLL